jgi:hypothetical protein
MGKFLWIKMSADKNLYLEFPHNRMGFYSITSILYKKHPTLPSKKTKKQDGFLQILKVLGLWGLIISCFILFAVFL